MLGTCLIRIEYFLTDLLPMVEMKYQKNKIVIQEFSDSDDEY